MGEPVTLDRLLPCLLDRLTDEEPDKRQEGRDRRVVSMRRYRQGVLGDLQSLLNAKNHSGDEELNEFPRSRVSVINFGIPDFSGVLASQDSLREMERGIYQAIVAFEPRVIASTLSVRGIERTEAGTSHAFEIRGTLWAQPMPEPLYIRTEIDLESGQCGLVASG